MKFLDALFGQRKPPAAKLNALFALSTAYVTLSARLNLAQGGRAGIAFRPAESSYFEALRRELEELLAISGSASQTRYSLQQDGFGYTWAVLEDEQLEDLIATVHLVSTTVQEHGFGPQLLAAAFRFEDEGKPVYWVYNYKRGAFYPFIPAGGRTRDNAKELRLKATMEAELPIESKLEQWYALWDLPV